MRIIGGTLKGRLVPQPPGSDTRPTTDVLKESLFSVLTHHIDFAGKRVLDLCAGSGQLSFEMLSRGSAHATMVDASALVCRHLRSVSKEFGYDPQVTIIKADVLGFLRNGIAGPFDVIVADPPYALKLCNHIAEILTTSPILAPSAIVVLEHGDQEAVIVPDGVSLLWHKERGSTVIDVLRYERPLP